MSETQKADHIHLEGIRTGDRQVIKRIYADYFPRIASYIRANSGTNDDARDLFQDVIMVIYQKASDPGFTLSASLYTFIYAVARNLWLKKLRKKERDWVTIDGEMVSIDETALMADEELRRHAQYLLYRKKFRELGDGCQQILQLSLAGKRVREIVSIMNISSEQYARKRKFKCKEQLIRLIRQDPAYEALDSEEEPTLKGGSE